MATRFCCVAASIVGLCLTGCQSWQAGGFPMQNGTRVPPPGTGTYQLPNGYYNNSTSSLVPQTPPLQAVAGNMRPASGALPTTDMVTANPVVSTASFSASTTSPPNSSFSAPVMAASNQQFTEPPRIEIPTNSAHEVPNLQWQQFSDH